MTFLSFFKKKKLQEPKQNTTFANEDEPTALAFTDLSKPSPILKGEDAKRFVEHMMKVDHERKAKMTDEDTIKLHIKSLQDLVKIKEYELRELHQRIEKLNQKLEIYANKENNNQES